VFTRSRRVWKVEWTSQSQLEGDDEVQDGQQYVSEPDVTAYDDGGDVVTDAAAEMTQWIDRMQEDNPTRGGPAQTARAGALRDMAAHQEPRGAASPASI
jgi:hypothetical protein